MSINPYSAPEGMSVQSTREDALAKVQMPATLLLVTGILSLMGSLVSAAIPVVMPQMMESFMEQVSANDPEFGQQERAQFESVIDMLSSPLNYLTAAVGLIGAIVMCVGALKMRNLENYALSMAACIVAICPYVSACCTCIFPIAIGIWGIVVLVNPDVKSHFS